MSVTNPYLTSTRTDFAQNHPILTTVRHIAGYGMGVGLGLLSGVISTALVMIVAIMIQIMLMPTAVFAPGIIFFAGMATVVGIGTSWLMAKCCRHLFPTLFDQAGGYGVLIVTIIGTITSLAQTITFMFIL